MTDTASDSDLIATIKDRRKKARDYRADWIKEANLCYNLVAGHQWSDDDKKLLEDQGRPPVTFNRVGPVIDVVAGLEVTNRQETRYIPREVGDAGVNEVLTGGAKWVRDECNAEDEESEAFVDMAITGEGWMETRLDYEYDPDGAILMERCDGTEMWPDPQSRKKNYLDAEYLGRDRKVPLDWVKVTWPEKAEQLAVTLQAADDDDSASSEDEAHRNIRGDQYRSPFSGSSDDGPTDAQVTLTEYQYKKRKPYYRVLDPQTGEIKEMSPGDHKVLQERAKTIGLQIQSVKQVKCEYWRSFSVGDVLLEDQPCPDPNSFSYKAMTAKRDKIKGRWYGLVRGMEDPQRWANKWLSQSMHILNSNAKGGVMIELDAVDQQNGGVQKFEASWADPKAITWLASGTLTANKIQQKQPPAFPPELNNLMQFAIQAIRDVSGVSVELLGMADRDQPASLEYQRKQAGVTILATLFDALRKYRKQQGKNLLYLIETYISDGRLIRIVGKQGEQYVPLVKNEGTSRYDVVVDESPTSPNMKEKVWLVLQQLLPVMQKMGVPIPPEVMEYLPLPQSMIDGFKKPDPAKQAEEQKKKALQERGAVAEITKTEAEAQEKQASAALKASQAQGAGNEGQAEAQTRMMELQQEGALKDRELTLEAQLRQQQMTMDNALKQQEAAFNARLDTWIAEQKAALDERMAEVNARIKEKMADKPRPNGSA